MDQQVVGVAVGKRILEPLLAGSGAKVDEFELKLAGVTAESLQFRYLRGLRQDHGAQGNTPRKLALGDEVLEYLGRVGSAGAADFAGAVAGELR